jgi:hypothetical protein
VATLSGHSKHGEFLNSFCIGGRRRYVRFSMTIMVGLLELSLLVRIGLGVRWEIKRRGCIASVTGSARIGEGSCIDLHGHGKKIFW